MQAERNKGVKMALKTNYKDDILDISKNEKRKYNMITNPDGTVSLDDVTVYTQEGDSFGATDINRTNEAVNKLTNVLTGTLTAGATSLTYQILPLPLIA